MKVYLKVIGKDGDIAKTNLGPISIIIPNINQIRRIWSGKYVLLKTLMQNFNVTVKVHDLDLKIKGVGECIAEQNFKLIKKFLSL